ncbi:hypothetical protein VTN31DRAFT_273 [Thermomyces dupontii]|uniref:uncharacterized protein n=1 Tax=Talaromyces thermophilus TaxID=28565 RepID=UPI003741F26F
MAVCIFQLVPHCLGADRRNPVVVNGTNAEAISLTPDEKARLITEARNIAVRLGKPNLPLTVGCSGGCTRDIIDQTIVAHRNGAAFALVLIPSYFHFALTPVAIVDFFREVADDSPIPVVIYNFPDVVAGLDVNSEMLEKLSAHPNICAVKLTCGGIAKAARVAETNDPRKFAALAGQGDWLFPALSVGGTGCIAGIANVFPRVSRSSRSQQTISLLTSADPCRDLHSVQARKDRRGNPTPKESEQGGMGPRQGWAQRDEMDRR